MNTQDNQRHNTSSLSDEAILIWVGVIIVLTGGTAIYIAMRLGHALAHTGVEVPANPITVIIRLLKGSLPWPGTIGWVIAGGVVAVILLLAILIIVARRSSKHKRTSIDQAASHMGKGRDIDTLSRKQTAATAQRLGVTTVPGLPVGITVSTGQALFSSWEDMRITIAGPRVGKTTSLVVPEILAAPGSVLVTSNKRDVVDATRDVRARRGPIWVFDPQSITFEPPTWWWNPLSYVTDEVRAAKLAEHFATGSRDVGAQTDAYFDPAGQDLLAGLLLAASLDNRPITDVYRWTTRPTDETALDILSAHGFSLQSDQVAGVVSAPEEQRGGVFGTAQQMASCLTNRQIAAWVTPLGPDDSRPQFSPEDFIGKDCGTLYSLSREGRGTAGPLITGLIVAVVEAAENLAARSAGGRLHTPLVGVLDEAANVCRWRELPNLYSHYGSRGIVLDTVLQSWSQGVDVWGESGMKKLWSAANLKIYGGGVGEASFLEDLSRMIGDYDRLLSSTSRTLPSTSDSHNQKSVSQQVQRERILDVSDLAALPKGRAVVFASGSRPTLIRTVPWMEGPYAKAVRASIAAHDPQAELTLRDTDATLIKEQS